MNLFYVVSFQNGLFYFDRSPLTTLNIWFPVCKNSEFRVIALSMGVAFLQVPGTLRVPSGSLHWGGVVGNLYLLMDHISHTCVQMAELSRQ